MKKLLPVLAVAVAMCAPAASALEFDDGMYHFVTIGESTDVMASINDYSKITKNVVIPTEVTFAGTTYTVTHLSGWMFSARPDTHPECNKIETVTLPERLTTFEYAVFEDCTGLKEIVFPESLKWIGRYCFVRCANLEKAILPPNVEVIEGEAFMQTGLTGELVIPDAVTTMGDNAFQSTRFTKITVGKGLSSISTGVFAWTPITEIVIPANVATLMPFCFQGIAASRVNVGSPAVIAVNAFVESPNLREVQVESTTPPVVLEGSFPFDTYSGKLIVPNEDCIAAYKADAVWGKFATIEAAKSGGLEDVLAEKKADTTVYNTQGIRVADDINDVTVPGLYIAGGKKVLVK